MANAPIELLLESLAEALETTAFVSLTPEENDSPKFDAACILSMPLGDACQIHFAASKQFGAMVAANILALEPESAEAAQRSQDALKEILNVTSGLYLMRSPWLEGRIPEMGIPTARYVDDAAQLAQWLKNVGAQIIVAENFPVAIAIEGRL